MDETAGVTQIRMVNGDEHDAPEASAEIIGRAEEAKRTGVRFIRIMERVPHRSPDTEVWLNSDQIASIRSSENDF